VRGWSVSRRGVELFSPFCVFSHTGAGREAHDGRDGDDIMETAPEIRHGQILRKRIEALRDEIARKRAECSLADADLDRLEKKIRRLTTNYRRAIARLADLDYRRRKAEWHVESRARLFRTLRAC
jgi:hypothetical protein